MVCGQHVGKIRENRTARGTAKRFFVLCSLVVARCPDVVVVKLAWTTSTSLMRAYGTYSDSHIL